MKRLHVGEGIMAHCQTAWWISRQCEAKNKDRLYFELTSEAVGPFPWDVSLRGMKLCQRIFWSPWKVFTFCLLVILLALFLRYTFMLHSSSNAKRCISALSSSSSLMILWFLQTEQHEDQTRSWHQFKVKREGGVVSPGVLYLRWVSQ